MKTGYVVLAITLSLVFIINAQTEDMDENYGQQRCPFWFRRYRNRGGEWGDRRDWADRRDWGDRRDSEDWRRSTTTTTTTTTINPTTPTIGIIRSTTTTTTTINPTTTTIEPTT